MSTEAAIGCKDNMTEPKLGLIPRSEFVDVIFDLAEEYDHALSTIVSAVMLGDRYVSGNSNYTYELAHAALLVSAKACEDDGYRYTPIALAYVNSSTDGTRGAQTVTELEWKLLPLFSYHNFITLYHRITDEVISSERCYTICSHPEFEKWSPVLVTMALVCLRRVSKL